MNPLDPLIATPNGYLGLLLLVVNAIKHNNGADVSSLKSMEVLQYRPTVLRILAAMGPDSAVEIMTEAATVNNKFSLHLPTLPECERIVDKGRKPVYTHGEPRANIDNLNDGAPPLLTSGGGAGL